MRKVMVRMGTNKEVKIEDILLHKITGVVAGIYMIKEGNRVYVGSANGKPSNGIMKRLTNWKWRIENGKTKYFNDINKVTFEILEIVPNDISDEELSDLELDYFKYVQRVGFDFINDNKEVAVRHSVKDTTKMKLAQSGEKNPRCRLSDADIAALRKEYENGSVAKELAEKYGISHNYCLRIIKGEVR